jgi:hypothetical protein
MKCRYVGSKYMHFMTANRQRPNCNYKSYTGTYMQNFRDENIILEKFGDVSAKLQGLKHK